MLLGGGIIFASIPLASCNFSDNFPAVVSRISFRSGVIFALIGLAALLLPLVEFLLSDAS